MNLHLTTQQWIDQFSVLIDNGYGAVIVHETQDGLLRCEDDDEHWCTHIETVVRDNMDAGMLWRRRDEVEDIHGYESVAILIQVPLLPTRNLWTQVALEDSGVPDARMLNLLEPNDGTLDILPPLGYVHPGEGRYAIRTQIIDWFNSVVDPVKLQCRDSAHGFPEEMIWQRNLSDNRYRFAEHWSVFMKGRCITCWDHTDDFSDLVPQDDSNKWSAQVHF